ncbi:PaaI family thioesterase [Nocardioides sp.]|uniref:PaaI family thioesterase n=1 Tax=Nocardioides sp. TaxID=35761 RepID=UPI0039E52456
MSAVNHEVSSAGERTRTYDWADPIVLATAATTMSGLEFLRAIGAGELPPPPVMATTGITAVEVSEGFVAFEVTPAEWHYNPIGSVHGGILSTLADSALACAVHSTLPAGTGYTSLDLVMKFTRAATIDSGRLRCEGRVVTRGRRAATAEGRITDEQGRVIAHAVTTCLIMES